MDQTSLCFCRDNNLDVRVFNANSNGALLEALINKKTDLGTLVKLKMIEEIQLDAKEGMAKTLEALESSFKRIRTSRANISLLDSIEIDYYGNKTPLNQVSNISVEDAKTLAIVPWEKDNVPLIEKSIQQSDLGLQPITSGETIRVILPDLTEETRRDLIKVAKAEAENSKVSIRNQRRDANGLLKEYLNEKEISEDDLKRGEVLIQEVTDQYVESIDNLLKEKEKTC